MKPHPLGKPEPHLIPQLKRLQAYYASTPIIPLCFAARDMDDSNLTQELCCFFTKELSPHASLTSWWLSANFRDTVDCDMGDTARKHLRTVWLEYLLS